MRPCSPKQTKRSYAPTFSLLPTVSRSSDKILQSYKQVPWKSIRPSGSCSLYHPATSIATSHSLNILARGALYIKIPSTHFNLAPVLRGENNVRTFPVVHKTAQAKCRKGWRKTMCFLGRKQSNQAHGRVSGIPTRMCIVKCHCGNTGDKLTAKGNSGNCKLGLQWVRNSLRVCARAPVRACLCAQAPVRGSSSASPSHWRHRNCSTLSTCQTQAMEVKPTCCHD